MPHQPRDIAATVACQLAHAAGRPFPRRERGPKRREVEGGREGGRRKRKGARVDQDGGPDSEKDPAASYSPTRKPCSTIGSGGLNDRVRDGNGCDPSDVATGKRTAGKPAYVGTRG